MKKGIFYIGLAFLATACSAPDKKTELENLVKQKVELEAKITALEEELKKSGADSTAGKSLEVVAEAITPQIFKTYIEVQGRIDADESVYLSSEMPGTLTQINVKAGDEVSKGQTLAETDARAIQQQLSDIQTNLEMAGQVYQKQKNLWDQKIGTEIQYLQAKTTKESLEKKMATLQEQLRMTKIISPINGTVDAVNVKIGQAIAPGIPAISVVNFSNLKVKADIAETYAARVKKGNEVQVYFPDMNDSVTTKVNHSSRAINPLNRTFGVEVILDSKNEYHPNMVAKLKINDFSSPAPVVAVPVKFIQRGTNEAYVYVAEGDKARKRVIKTGHEYNGVAEITEGLKEGDLLITAGYDLVSDGMMVTIRK